MQTKSVAIVTGASQGIGRPTAIRLASDFQAVVLVARQEDELERTAASVESSGAEALTHALDLRKPESADTLIQERSNVLGELTLYLTLPVLFPRLICSR